MEWSEVKPILEEHLNRIKYSRVCIQCIIKTNKLRIAVNT